MFFQRPKIRDYFNVVCLLTAMAVPSSSYADKLTVAFSIFPPFSNDMARAKPEGPGLLVAYYKNVLPKLGYDLNLSQIPPKRIQVMMDRGDGIDLYVCGDYSKGKRPHYTYGPRFISVHVVLIQNAKQTKLANIMDLKNTQILKQHGFGGMTKLLNPSNKYLLAYDDSLISMFTLERSHYLLEFKERFDYMAKSHKNLPDYRIYKVRKFDGFLCLNKRFGDSEKRIKDIHNAMVNFQDTATGRKLIAKYAFSGRLGN